MQHTHTAHYVLDALNVYKIKTFHNSYLYLDKNKIVHAKKCDTPDDLLYLVKVDSGQKAIVIPQTNLAYLADLCTSNKVCTKPCVFGLFHNSCPSLAHIVSLHSIDKEQVTLRGIYPRYLLSACRLENDLQVGTMMQNKNLAKEWEFFKLEKTMRQNIFFTTYHKQICELLHQINAQNLIRQFYVYNHLLFLFTLYLYVPILSYSEMERLSKHVIHNRKLQTSLLDICKDDLYIQHGLRSLFSNAHLPTSIDQTFDQLILNTNLQNGKDLSIGYMLNAYVRQQIKPKHKSLVVTAISKEGVYLLEWVAYYKALGFDQILIYSNDNDDYSDELLEALTEEHYISWIKNYTTIPQRDAYAHALSILPATLNYEWALFCDMDEYFVFNADLFENLTDFLDWHNLKTVDLVALNWLMVGSNNQISYEDDFIFNRFPYAVSSINFHIKSLLKPRRFCHSHVHFANGLDKDAIIYRESNAELHLYDKQKAFSTYPTMSHAFLLHFYQKSVEEYICKLMRGRGDLAADQRKDDVKNRLQARSRLFLSLFNKKNIDILPYINKACPQFHVYFQQMLEHSSIRLAQQKIKQNFREKLPGLIAQFKTEFQDVNCKEFQQILDLLHQRS